MFQAATNTFHEYVNIIKYYLFILFVGGNLNLPAITPKLRTATPLLIIYLETIFETEFVAMFVQNFTCLTPIVH
jgi:hypothetical protein